MKCLDLDMDYFMKCDVHIGSDSSTDRLSEDDYGYAVWSEQEVRHFFEKNLGLSKTHRIPGRIVSGHNESLFLWQDLISAGKLAVPFEVVHVDTHADLGLGYASWAHICRKMLAYPVNERPKHAEYEAFNKIQREGIGDYLLYAIAYRMISSLTYCGNPNKPCNDYIVDTLKGFKEEYVFESGDPVRNTIQLLYNPQAFDCYTANETEKRRFISRSVKEPEVPFLIIPRIEDVHFDGDFDYAVMAQSPNYTPVSADYIMDVFGEYIDPI